MATSKTNSQPTKITALKPTTKSPHPTPAHNSPAQPVPTPKKRSGLKVLLIIVAVLVILGAGGYVLTKYVLPNAVRSAVEKTVNKISGGKIKLTDTSYGLSLSDSSRQNAVTTNDQVIAGWPNDVPMYPGAVITTSGKVKGTNYDTVLNTSDTSQKVISYYQTALPQNGWAVDNSSTGNNTPGLTTLVYKKDNRSATIVITTTQNNKTAINLTVVPTPTQ